MKVLKITLHKIAFVLALTVSLVAVSCESGNSNGASTEQEKGSFGNVNVADLNAAISNSDDILILDVRTPKEVSQGYIENAIKIDVNGSTFAEQAKDLDKTKRVYVYCRSGHRSQTASKKLVQMGFTDVWNVEGGFIAWTEKGFKSVK